MKSKKIPNESKAKAGLIAAINKAAGIQRKARGPQPERFKIEGYADWKDAVKVAMAKRKPKEGWPK